MRQDWFDSEVKALIAALSRGEITIAEYRAEVSDLKRERQVRLDCDDIVVVGHERQSEDYW